MALTIDLESVGPGRGRLHLGGGRWAPMSVSLAIQRNDGRYLGPQQQWQVTAHWHPQFSADPTLDGLRLEIGPELVDGIIAVGGTPLRLVLRLDGQDLAGILRIRGALVGSGAAAPRAAQPVTAVYEEPLSLDLDDVSDTVVTPVPTPPRRPRWPWVVLAIALVVALMAAGIGAWWFGWLEPGPPDEFTTDPGSGEAQSTPEAPERSPEAAVTGIAFAKAFLADRPSAQASYARAEQAEAAGDCPAAYALFSDAANADPALAAGLARRYDPLTHVPGTCIGVPDIPYAIVYYTDAAEAGDTAVQRRLGQLMMERETSGATRETGIQWLRKAADAGDVQARQILDGLSEP